MHKSAHTTGPWSAGAFQRWGWAAMGSAQDSRFHRYGTDTGLSFTQRRALPHFKSTKWIYSQRRMKHPHVHCILFGDPTVDLGDGLSLLGRTARHIAREIISTTANLV